MTKTSKPSAKAAKPATEDVASAPATPSPKPDATPPRKMTTEERDLAVRLASASIADAIGLYMRSDRHKHMSIADLEWMLLPPLMFNQIKFAYARPTQVKANAKNVAETVGRGDEKLPPMVVAMITWAMVSPEVAAKLEAQRKAGQSFRLAPQEWRSGKEMRLIDLIGAKQAVDELVKRVAS